VKKILAVLAVFSLLCTMSFAVVGCKTDTPKSAPDKKTPEDKKTDPKVDPKTDPKVDPKVDPKTDPKVDPKTDPKK